MENSTTIWSILAPILVVSIGVERAIEILWNYLEWLLLSLLRWHPGQLKSAHYVQFKSGTSLVLGLILGMLVASYTQMRLFEFFKPLAPGLLTDMPIGWDILITGFLIGAGAKPMHDLLGILTQLKYFLNSSAIRQREAAAAALADGVLKLAQSEAQAMVDVPGIGPARMPLGANRSGATEEDDQAAEKPATERYVELLRSRTAV